MGADRIELSWKAPAGKAETAATYRIFRSGKSSSVGTSTTTFFDDNGLKAATTYSYTVSACAAPGNCSAPSAPATAVTFKWMFTGSGAGAFFTPALGADGTIYDAAGGGADPHLYALKPNGRKKWAFAMNGPGIGPPAMDAKGNIYAASSSTLYSISPAGAQNWTFALNKQGGQALFSPAIGNDGTIYAGVALAPAPACGSLTALNPNGAAKWTFATGAAQYTPPVIGADGTIYVGISWKADVAGCNDKKNLYAVNPDNTVKWVFGGGAGYSWLALDAKGNILAAGPDAIVSISPAGAQNWTVTAGSAPWSSSPAVDASGNIYAASGNDLYSMSPSGEENWMFAAAEGNDLSSPALAANGTIYTGSSGRSVSGEFLFAIDSKGTSVWGIGGGVFSSPTIGTDGTVFAGDHSSVGGKASGNGALVAIPGNSPLADSSWPKAQRDLRNSGSY